MRYCPTCSKVYSEMNRRFCPLDGVRLSLKDPFKLVGTVMVDKYRLDALVGIGGFGAVYSAHHLRIDRHVAVKILLPHFSVSDNKFSELFEQEAKMAGRLNHENIVDVKDAGRTPEGIAYMVMEWLEGRTLEEEIATSERLSFGRAADILRQVSAALDEAHTAHIIHRDLKPSNIMIVKRQQGQDRVKVLDFGIAKIMSSTTGAAVSAAIGTPHYASPEQVREGGSIDTRSDIYSLGVMLYQMLTGALPFNARSLQELILLQLTAPPPPVRKLRPDAPLAIEQLIESMLAKEPEYRPERASEVSRLFDLGVKVKQLSEEGKSAFEGKEYGLAITKLEELLRLSPDEPGAREMIYAARAAQAETGRRTRIDRLLLEASQAADSGEHGAAVSKWEEVLRLSPDEPGVGLKIQSAREAQAVIEDEARKGQAHQEKAPDKESKPGRSLMSCQVTIASIAVMVVAIATGVIWLSMSKRVGPIPQDQQASEQNSPAATTGSKNAPPPVTPSKVTAMAYYIEVEEDAGRTTRAGESYPFKAEQRFRLHFIPQTPGYLYIIAPGTQLHPTTYLTAKPIAATGVSTNEVSAGDEFQFPGGDNWMRVRSGIDTTRITVIFSRDPLQSPAYLASKAGARLNDDEYLQLEKFGPSVKPGRSGDLSTVEVDAGREELRKPLMFDIHIRPR